MAVLGVFDLVTVAYLFVHATTRNQLAAMCQAIVEHYRSGVTVPGSLYEGAPLDVTMLTANGPLHLRDYYWSQATYESVLHQVGFERLVWHAMQASVEGFEVYGKAYWQDYLRHPHIVVLEAQR